MSCAVRRSSTLRKPALTNALALPSARPLRSQAFEASQYSSNDKALRLTMSDTSISPILRRARPEYLEGSYGGPPLRKGGTECLDRTAHPK